jgi:hypothetical protein
MQLGLIFLHCGKVEKDAVHFNTFESASLYHWSV